MSTVVGFAGSSIWKYIAMFPPASGEMIDAGDQDFAGRWNPKLDLFDEVGVQFIWNFRDRMYHADCRDTEVRPRDGRRGVLGSYLPWADPRRGWTSYPPATATSTGRTASGC